MPIEFPYKVYRQVAEWKTTNCTKKKCNGQSNKEPCNFVHYGEARRRNPYIVEDIATIMSMDYPYSYSPGECTSTEKMYHPLLFMTKVCRQYSSTGKCSNGKWCFAKHIFEGICEDTNCKPATRLTTYSHWKYMVAGFKTQECKDETHSSKTNFWTCPYYHSKEDKITKTCTLDNKCWIPAKGSSVIASAMSPETFQTTLCKYGEQCNNYKYCRFAHNKEEINNAIIFEYCYRIEALSIPSQDLTESPTINVDSSSAESSIADTGTESVEIIDTKESLQEVEIGTVDFNEADIPISTAEETVLCVRCKACGMYSPAN